jgi:hypothetical protein
MINYIFELTFLLYGLFLLYKAQYLTCLILLVLSLILITKGFRYKESIIITIIFLLFLTQYHVYFPYREHYVNNEGKESNESIEGFKSNAEKKEDARIRKQKRSEKKDRIRLKREIKSSYAGYPRRYIKNKMKIDKKSKDWSEALNKWSLLKENFFIILNKN